jgi:transposase
MKKFSTSVANGAHDVTVVGLTWRRTFFPVHGIETSGKPRLERPDVWRDQLLNLLKQLPPCIIGMEASSGAHHRAHPLVQFGHKAQLMAPKFVALYRM